MKAPASTATIVTELEKWTVVRVLWSNLDWTLHDLLALVDDGGAGSVALGNLRLSDLMTEPGTPPLRLPSDDGPIIDLDRLHRAQQLHGEGFDRVVLEVLVEAGPRSASASHLRARVGGPRWKLQGSLRRLVDAGQATRAGITSTTRYMAV